MIEYHPYGDYIPKYPRCMIVGSFPIAKFTDPSRRKNIKENEMDFFFGGEKNRLWKLLGHVFSREIKNKEDAVNLLETFGIAIGDVIVSCKRKNGSASDSDLYEMTWNDNLINLIRAHKIQKLYFTSKKVEYWFNRLFPDSNDLKKDSLISPSAQSLRSLGKNEEYLHWKSQSPKKDATDFLKLHYKKKLKWLIK